MDSVTVFVNPSPTVILSDNVNQPVSGTVYFNNGSSVLLTAHISKDVINEYWYSDTTLVTSDIASLSVAQSGLYSIVVYNKTCQAVSAPVNVQIINSLTLGINASPSSSVCSGSQATLSANVIGGTGHYTYVWSTGDSSASISVNPTVSSNYYVTVNDGLKSLKDSVALTVLPLPTASISPKGPLKLISGASATLTATVGKNVISKMWQSDGTDLGSTSSTYLAKQTGNYTILVTDNNGCSFTSIPVDIWVGTYTAMNVGVSVTPKTVCPGAESKLSVTASGGTGNYTYKWNAPNDQFLAQQSVYPLKTTSYNVTVSDGFSTIIESGTVSVTAPAVYNLTGTSVCDLSGGADVGLSGSVVGVNYALQVTGTLKPTPSSLFTLPGTGSALDFGSQQQAGTYTVYATNILTNCSATMTGSVNIYPVPAVFKLTGGGCYSDVIGLDSSVTGVEYNLYQGRVYCNFGIDTTFVAEFPGTGSALDFGPQSAAGPYTVIAKDITTGCATTVDCNYNVYVLSPSFS